MSAAIHASLVGMFEQLSVLCNIVSRGQSACWFLGSLSDVTAAVMLSNGNDAAKDFKTSFLTSFYELIHVLSKNKIVLSKVKVNIKYVKLIFLIYLIFIFLFKLFHLLWLKFQIYLGHLYVQMLSGDCISLRESSC